VSTRGVDGRACCLLLRKAMGRSHISRRAYATRLLILRDRIEIAASRAAAQVPAGNGRTLPLAWLRCSCRGAATPPIMQLSRVPGINWSPAYCYRQSAGGSPL
jgi:hypothetical protein